MNVILHSHMGHILVICGAWRFEQDHLNYYLWSGSSLVPQIISKKAGVLTILDLDTETEVST